MKMYITSRFKNAIENREEIENLCRAVRKAGWEDFHFIRDIENFDPRHFASQQEVWEASLKTLKECDALLVDVSDAPSGGRNVEIGMAYALNLPIFVIVKRGTLYKEFYNGVAKSICEYDSFDDVTSWLRGRTV